MAKQMEMEFSTIGNTLPPGISLLAYSNPGSGKTTLLGTLPIGETLIINVEGGTGPLLGSGHTVLNITSGDDMLTELDKIYKFLRTETHPFKYVGVDNISEIEQNIIMSLTKRRLKEFTEIREYGDATGKMREYLRLFRDLATEKGISVFFTAWEQVLDVKQDTGVIETLTLPKLSKNLSKEVCGLMNIVCRVEVHEKSQKRWLRIGASDKYITKTQFKGLESGETADLPMLLEKIYAYDYKEEGDGDNK